jgi:hypothetical protein
MASPGRKRAIPKKAKPVIGKAVHVKPDQIEEFGWIEKGKIVRAGKISRPKPPKGWR